MKKYKVAVLTILISIFFALQNSVLPLVSFAAEETNSSVWVQIVGIGDTNLYGNNSDNYTIKYPKDWMLISPALVQFAEQMDVLADDSPNSMEEQISGFDGNLFWAFYTDRKSSVEIAAYEAGENNIPYDLNEFVEEKVEELEHNGINPGTVFSDCVYGNNSFEYFVSSTYQNEELMLRSEYITKIDGWIYEIIVCDYTPEYDETLHDGIDLILETLSPVSGDMTTQNDDVRHSFDLLIDTEEAEREVTEYHLGQMYYSVPSDWTLIEEDAFSYYYVSEDNMNYMMVMYMESNQLGNMDLRDEAFVSSIIDGFYVSASENTTIENLGYVTVCGCDALWMVSNNGIEKSYFIYFAPDNALAEIAYSNSNEDISELLKILDGLYVNGTTGYTDLDGLFGL